MYFDLNMYNPNPMSNLVDRNRKPSIFRKKKIDYRGFPMPIDESGYRI